MPYVVDSGWGVTGGGRLPGVSGVSVVESVRRDTYRPRNLEVDITIRLN
jgi:hypothetical protein